VDVSSGGKDWDAVAEDVRDGVLWRERGREESSFLLGRRMRRGSVSKEGQRQRHSPSIGMRVVGIGVLEFLNWMLSRFGEVEKTSLAT
jgi:hypothetical protein